MGGLASCVESEHELPQYQPTKTVTPYYPAKPMDSQIDLESSIHLEMSRLFQNCHEGFIETRQDLVELVGTLVRCGYHFHKSNRCVSETIRA